MWRTLIPDYVDIGGYYPTSAFYNKKKSSNSVSLAISDSLTYVWNSHYNPIRFLSNGNIVHNPSKIYKMIIDMT